MNVRSIRLGPLRRYGILMVLRNLLAITRGLCVFKETVRLLLLTNRLADDNWRTIKMAS